MGHGVSEPALRIRGLTLGYDRHPAVHHLDAQVPTGTRLALVGPNGAGKSTLLKGLAGELPALEGRIERKGSLAYLPQAAQVDRSFPLSVLDLVATGLWRRGGLWRSLARDEDAMRAALDSVGLAGFEKRAIGTLSGGQFQRVLFARLMLQDADIILLDEPFSGIDLRTTADLLALIEAWHAQGRTIVAALHDLGQVRAHFPHTLLIAREPIAYGPTETVLTRANLERALSLSEAWDEAAAICRRGPDHDHAHDHPHDHSHDHGRHPHGHPPAAEAAE